MHCNRSLHVPRSHSHIDITLRSTDGTDLLRLLGQKRRPWHDVPPHDRPVSHGSLHSGRSIETVLGFQPRRRSAVQPLFPRHLCSDGLCSSTNDNWLCIRSCSPRPSLLDCSGSCSSSILPGSVSFLRRIFNDDSSICLCFDGSGSPSQ